MVATLKNNSDDFKMKSHNFCFMSVINKTKAASRDHSVTYGFYFLLALRRIVLKAQIAL